MKGFKKCSKGHFYKEDKSSCPYCPKNSSSDEIKTEFLSKNESNSDNDPSKTQVFGDQSSTPNSDSSNKSSSNEPFDATKTMIIGNENTTPDDSPNSQVRRRLRGWLVSFDIEDFGVDFKILEGKNWIGKKSSNDITIQDNQVSSVHALVLCRKDKFLLSDEMSSNGTTVNGQDLPLHPSELYDGDEIKIGNTKLLFRTAFKS
ncbi:FHA domain-containing protein [Flavobacteriaceae bacterium]|nr:FHA domain-containing protein [Flavobacteriaceae bacterium]MDC1493030.1 FHA domain-containing protein [Flavobacteriaceae bacterium]